MTLSSSLRGGVRHNACHELGHQRMALASDSIALCLSSRILRFRGPITHVFVYSEVLSVL